MKTLLLASTALVATAGIAAADVTITGSAELGIFENENNSGDGASGDPSKVRVFSDVNVTFAMTGETDGGLSFGATVDLDEVTTDDDMNDAARLPDATIFLAYGPMRLTVGDTDSAFDARLTETAIGDALNDDHTVHPGYSGNSELDEAYGGQEIRVDYSFDAFTGSLSVAPDRNDTDFDTAFALGVSYDMDLAGLNLGLGLGYQQVDEAAALYDTRIGLSAATTFANGIQAIVNYTHWSDDSSNGADDASHYAIGLGYTMNALTLGVNYGEFDLDDDFAPDSSGFGITANYDLGGGLEAQLGYGGGDIDIDGLDYEDTFSLGVKMSF
ncbi:porin [Marivita sp. S0852]|uniref:porin n=1 Tax=Marivita sp. S0852 TaxID=3373893 RepID=UPI0039821176